MNQTLASFKAGPTARTISATLTLLLVLAGLGWLAVEAMVDRGLVSGPLGVALVLVAFVPVIAHLGAMAWALVFRRGAALYVRDGRLVYLAPWLRRAPLADVRGVYPVLRSHGFWQKEYIRIDFASGRPVHMPTALIAEYVDVTAHRIRQVAAKGSARAAA